MHAKKVVYERVVVQRPKPLRLTKSLNVEIILVRYLSVVVSVVFLVLSLLHVICLPCPQNDNKLR